MHKLADSGGRCCRKLADHSILTVTSRVPKMRIAISVKATPSSSAATAAGQTMFAASPPAELMSMAAEAMAAYGFDIASGAKAALPAIAAARNGCRKVANKSDRAAAQN